MHARSIHSRQPPDNGRVRQHGSADRTDEPQLGGQRDGVGAIGRPQFLNRIFDVEPGGVSRDPQPRRDLLVSMTLGDMSEAIYLAR